MLGGQSNAVASQWILICLMPFIAKFAVGIGPKVNEIIAAGPALYCKKSVMWQPFYLPCLSLC